MTYSAYVKSFCNSYLATLAQTTGPIFDSVFHRAIFVEKVVTTETGIENHTTSVSNTAVELVKRIFDYPSRKRVMLIETGGLGKHARIDPLAAGLRDLIIANRTIGSA